MGLYQILTLPKCKSNKPRPIRDSQLSHMTVELSSREAPSLCLRRRNPGLVLGRLPLDAHYGAVGFITFIPDSFLGFCAKRFLVRIFWRLAMAPDHFVAALHANHPVRFPAIPGNFHSIDTHSPSTRTLPTL